MVPLTDIFNHKASIVALSDGYGIEEYVPGVHKEAE